MKKRYYREFVKQLVFTLIALGAILNVSAQVIPTSNSPICVGQNIQLYGGAPGLPTDYYEWSNFDGSWTSTAQNPIIPVGTSGYAPGLFSLSVNSSNSVTTVVIFASTFIAGTASTSQTICYNTVPAQLTATAPTGGVQPYTYQWQRSPDNSTWTNISSATNLTYQPGALTSTTYYRLSQTPLKCGFQPFTNVVTVYVKGPRGFVTFSGAGAKNGTSWSNAYDHTQLQAAINDLCVNEVWVAAGTYTPTVEAGGSGSRYKTFKMKNGVSIFGGFSGTETLLTQRNIAANPTILSGDLNGDDNYSVTPWTGTAENSYHVFNHSGGLGLTGSAILDGFTIVGGNANGTGNQGSGGGMYNVSSSPSLSNCSFFKNSATIVGGAMYNIASNLTLTNCDFTSNHAGWGGAISTHASSGQTVNQILYNCSFNSNIGTGGGGAINHGAPNSAGAGLFDCTNCRFVNNVSHDGSTFGGGGAFFNEHTGFDGKFTNCLFDGNKGLGTADWGGGAFLIFEGNCTIINSTIVNSQSATEGGAVSIYSANSHVNIQNSIFWNNTAVTGNTIYNGQGGTSGIVRSLVEDIGCPSNVTCGTGMIYNLDPVFVDASAGDFRPFNTSPCLDSGDDTYNSKPTDIRGGSFSRKLNKLTGAPGTIDMGAYEYKFGTDPVCTNPTNGGTIASNQSGFSPFDPAPITGTVSPIGNVGTLEYKWQQSVTSNNSGFTDIDSSNAVSYDPKTLTQTTRYKRLVRTTCQPGWTGAAESNVVTITVNPMIPVNNVLTNITVTDTRCYNALQTITLAGNGASFTVQPTGNVMMIAGQNIFCLPGTTVHSGGYLHGYITTTGQYCLTQPPPIPAVVAGDRESPSNPDRSFFRVFPNPTAGKFTVEIQCESKPGKITVDIYGMKGYRILTKELPDDRRHEFSLEGMPSGIYLVRIVSEENSTMVRVIKQ